MDDDVLVLRILEEQLTPLGVEVVTVRDSIQAVPKAVALLPELIIVNRTMPILNGAEILRSLRSFPQTLAIPVAFMTADASELTLVRCIRSGAVDVFHKPLTAEQVRRIAQLLEELKARPYRGGSPTTEQRAKVLLGVYRHEAREGVLRLNPGTPFEGRAVFDRGELKKAEFGPAVGLDALGEMLSFEEGNWRFEPGLPEEITERIRAPEPAPPKEGQVHLAGDHPLRLILVDDDPDLRRLFRAQLTRAGFVVDLAEDGREGLQLARGRDYDLMVADLNMPRLDGWGMLRELRADYRTRELPVLFLSAHDDYRETLRAAKSGAWDYLPKTGRADAVIQRALQALLPRQRAYAEVLMGEPVDVDLALVGPRWLLRTLAAQKASGVLEAKDDWATYRFALREGTPVWAKAIASNRETAGVNAIGALLISRGARGRFLPGSVTDPSTFDLDMERLLDHACAALNELESRAVSSRIEQGGNITVDPELYTLYRQVSNDRDLLIARAVCEQKVQTHDLAQRLSIPPEEIEAGLADLLRRRVIRFS